MKFLKALEFSKEEMDAAKNSSPKKLVALVEKSKDQIVQNINFLKDLGVSNYKEIFIKFAGMFVMDPSTFESIFLKYDREDLIEKLTKNIAIIEHL